MIKYFMTWIIFALLAALFTSLKDVAGKHGIKSQNPYTMAFIIHFTTFLMLFPLALLAPIPRLTQTFFFSLLPSAIFFPFTTIFYLKALRASDISVSIPFLSFTPLFLLIMSPLLVNEWPTPLGVFGVILIVIGSYMLNINQLKNGFMAPFQAIYKDKGPRYILLVAFFFSITSITYRIGSKATSPLFFVASVNLMMTGLLFPLALWKKGKSSILPKIGLKYLLMTGVLSGLQEFTTATGLSMALAPYVISVKRLSILISVLFGYLFFKEKNIKERFLGATIMIVGVILIAIS